MKTLFLIVFVFCFAAANAQLADRHFIYLKGGISPGNYFGGGYSLNYIYKEKYSVQLGYSTLSRDARSTPDDYHEGVIGIFTFEMLYPWDEINSYEVLIGRVKKLNAKGTIRLNLKGGIGFSSYETPHNWEYIGEYVIGPNYAYEYQQKNTIGVILKPEVDFPFTRIFGMSASPYFMLNPETTAVGVEINLLLGILRAK